MAKRGFRSGFELHTSNVRRARQLEEMKDAEEEAEREIQTLGREDHAGLSFGVMPSGDDITG